MFKIMTNIKDDILQNTTWNNPVVLLEDDDILGPAGTIIVRFFIPFSKQYFLAVSTKDTLHPFSLHSVTDFNIKLRCRPIFVGESITLTSVDI